MGEEGGIMDEIYNDNRTVVELTQPIDRDYRAWQRIQQMEKEYNEKHEERHRGEKNGRSL